ncbi:MFS transporter [Nocardiopsis terrae]|uniref:MFS family permease n=1 Tax=Nocardiopsis terrae TaxID=372655 RepID=A0ABR9HE33_9ACTN|nr:MFS transporter [Nocardiopsis terrae]MBE1457294.1 MFS family permease [Nocardiopsis terrae]GHC91599.1 MFS transporter [Nocardiopsis terrae]
MRPIVGLITSEALAYTGTRLAMIAIPWFVLETTGSPAQMGLVTLFELGAYTLARLFVGPLLDRVGQRAVSIRVDLIAAAALLAVPILFTAGLLPFPVLLALVTVIGLATGPSEAAKVSLAPFVAAAANVRVERVTGLAGTVDRLSMTVGPIAAGAVVAALGALTALYVNAVLMVLSALVMAFLLSRGTEVAGPARTDPEEGDGYLARLHAGWRAVWGDLPLRMLVAMILVTNIVDVAVMSLALPVWAHEGGWGAEAVGLVAGTLGGASVVGSLVAAWVGHRLPRRAAFFAAMVIAGPPRVLVLALDVPLWVVLVVWAVSGLGGGLINPILSAVIFERLPGHMVGRGMSMVGALARVGAPIAAPGIGAAIGLLGVSPVLAAGAAVYLAAVALPAFGRAAKRLERPLEEPGTAPQGTQTQRATRARRR